MQEWKWKDSMDAYLEVSKYINWKDPGILKKAEEFRQRMPDEIPLVRAMYEFVRDEIRHSWDVQDKRVTLVRAMYEFVRDEIRHSWDVQDKRVTKSASEVLEQGVGICWAKANLLAALLRACGIPAGICYQRLTLGNTPDIGFCIHALNAVYLKSLDRWIRLDARGNKPGIDAQFDLAQERLAFPVRRELGEVEYEGVYARPSKQLMHVLENSTDALDMYLHHLPDQLFVYRKATKADIEELV